MKPEIISEYRGPHTSYSFNFPEWGKTIELVGSVQRRRD